MSIATSSRSHSNAIYLSPEDILERARSIAPILREASQEIEDRRHLPEHVVEVLRNAGVFRAAMPTSWGGPGMTSMQQTELVEIISSGDTSAGWCTMIGMDSGIYSGFLPDDRARQLYPSLDIANSGWIHPQGRADRVDGGFRVSGKWRFASGVTHCSVLVAGCQVFRDGEPENDPRTGAPVHWRIMVAQPGDYEVIDNWNTTGLAGSGSRDYTVSDLFVPSENTFSLREPFRPGPLHAAPDGILRKMSGVPLGLARACLDYVRDQAGTRRDRESGTPWHEDVRVQTIIAECEMKLGAARSNVYDTISRQWDRLDTGAVESDNDRVSTTLARYNSFQVARNIVQELYDLVGASSIYKPSPMDRWLRDATTMCQHAVAQRSILALTGNVLLGGKSRSPFF